MKDYRLSEVKEMCKKNKKCNKCELYNGQRCMIIPMFTYSIPQYWEIDKEQPKEKETLKNDRKDDRKTST